MGGLYFYTPWNEAWPSDFLCLMECVWEERFNDWYSTLYLAMLSWDYKNMCWLGSGTLSHHVEDCFLERSYQVPLNPSEFVWMKTNTVFLCLANTSRGSWFLCLFRALLKAGGHVQTTQGTLLDCLVLVVRGDGGLHSWVHSTVTDRERVLGRPRALHSSRLKCSSPGVLVEKSLFTCPGASTWRTGFRLVIHLEAME